jgi:hypothetical protein
VVAVPATASIPAPVVEVVTNHAAAVGQGTGRVRPHRAAAEGIAAHARIGDPLKVCPGEFSSTTGKATGAEIPGCATIERATTVKPTAPVECAIATKVASAAVKSAIATEVTGATVESAIATEVAGSSKIPAAEVPAAKVAAAAPEVAAATAKVTTAAAKSSAPHRPAATATKASAAMAATAAVCPRDRRSRHLARDHGRHDHNSKPLSKLHWLMHRLFSETGWGRQISIHKSERSAHLLERQWRGVGQVHAVDPSLDHVRRRLPLA